MRLYRLPLSQVSVVIHRQSIVHSLVEYRDGAVLAQLARRICGCRSSMRSIDPQR